MQPTSPLPKTFIPNTTHKALIPHTKLLSGNVLQSPSTMRGPVPVTPLPPTPTTSVKYYHNERLCSQRSDEAITVSSLLVSQHPGTNNICLFTLNDFLRSRDPKPNEKLNHVQHCLKYKFCEQSKQNNDPHGGPGGKKNGNCIVNQLMGHFRD